MNFYQSQILIFKILVEGKMYEINSNNYWKNPSYMKNRILVRFGGNQILETKYIWILWKRN